LILLLSSIFGLRSGHIDYTQAFPQANHSQTSAESNLKLRRPRIISLKVGRNQSFCRSRNPGNKPQILAATLIHSYKGPERQGNGKM
jgi:hypothetical protein